MKLSNEYGRRQIASSAAFFGNAILFVTGVARVADGAELRSQCVAIESARSRQLFELRLKVFGLFREVVPTLPDRGLCSRGRLGAPRWKMRHDLAGKFVHSAGVFCDPVKILVGPQLLAHCEQPLSHFSHQFHPFPDDAGRMLMTFMGQSSTRQRSTERDTEDELFHSTLNLAKTIPLTGSP